MLPIGFTIGLPYIWIPSSCIHNEANSLITRQLQPRVPFSVAGGHAMDVACVAVERFLGMCTIDTPRYDWMRVFLEKYSLARRQQILLTMNKSMIADVRVKGFPKVEVMVGKPCAKRKVRFVSGFDDGYLAETGPEYYLWQKAVCKMYWGSAISRNQAKFLYTGGLQGDEIGEWFDRLKDKGYTFLLLDFSKFDSRNKTEVMERLYRIYKKHLSRELYDWLEQTFHKFGKTSQGIKFSVEATVASGRIDTSLGNTLIVFMLAYAIMYLLDPGYLPQMYISALGDDNNIAVPDFHHTIEDIQRVSNHLGHEADGLIISPLEYHKIEYCSQRLWQIQPTRSVLGPKIGRLLAKTFVCHKNVPSDHLIEHISGVLLGFRCYRFLPVFRAFYQRWFELHTGPAKRYYGESNPHSIQLKTEYPIEHGLIYHQFVEVYGFDPTELEKDILELDLTVGLAFTHPQFDLMLEVDGVSYAYETEDYAHYLTMVSGTAETLNW